MTAAAVTVRPGRGALVARRRARWAGLLVAGVAVATALSVAVGAKTIAPGHVLDALLRYDAGIEDHVIVHDLRIPRTLLGLAVGAALGLAGAVMQGVTRNPLADPGLLGVNAGAALGVVLAISLVGATTPVGYIGFAFAGAALAGVLVHGLGSLGRGGATPVKLAIAGAAVTALLSSLSGAALLLDTNSLDRFRFWAVGSLVGRDASVLVGVLPFLAVGAGAALAVSRALDGLALGEDVARGLGQRVGRQRGLAAVAVVLLCGAATAAVGPISFVGLTVPHVARGITGPAHRWLLPFSAAMGAILLTLADVVARVVVRPAELEVGIVTALVGAPVFIAFVRRRRVAEL